MGGNRSYYSVYGILLNKNELISLLKDHNPYHYDTNILANIHLFDTDEGEDLYVNDSVCESIVSIENYIDKSRYGKFFIYRLPHDDVKLNLFADEFFIGFTLIKNISVVGEYDKMSLTHDDDYEFSESNRKIILKNFSSKQPKIYIIADDCLCCT